MSIKQIRLSGQAKDQLIRLKTPTGIARWNFLCRRASCLSLQQPTPPTPVEIAAESDVEMEGQVVKGRPMGFILPCSRSARAGWVGTL